jgi:hypothetical protein
MEALISTSYKRERDSELYIVTKRIVESMKNNANFPNPPAALTALEKLLPEYDSSLTNAKGRDREMVAIKKAKKRAMVALLTEVASYVTLICNGDETLLLNSGFSIVGQSKEQQPMPAIQKLIVELGPPGAVTISVKRVRGARAYLHQYTSEQPTSETVWTNEGTTSPSYIFRGLKSFTKYWFRVVALGPNGQTEYSPVDFRVIQ